MPPALEITGKKWGRLTAVRVVRHRGMRAWVFRCDCGKESTCVANDVQSGRTKSCGCARLESAKRNGILRRKAPGEACFNQIIVRYKQRCRRSRRIWALSRGLAHRLLTALCHYCGTPPARVMRAPYGRWGEFIYNGIDRVDNARGYTPRNSVPCCTECNYANGKMSAAAFLALATRIHNHTMEVRYGSTEAEAG